MCHWEEGQLVSNMDMVWARPCSTTFNDSSMHALWSKCLDKKLRSLRCWVYVNRNWHQVASGVYAWWTQTTPSLLMHMQLVFISFALGIDFMGFANNLGSFHLATTLSLKNIESRNRVLSTMTNNLLYAWKPRSNRLLWLCLGKSPCCLLVRTTRFAQS